MATRKVGDFATGAAPQGSNVAAARTVQVKTVVTNVPAMKYGVTSTPAGARGSRYH